MPSDNPRYSQLAPLGTNLRTQLAIAAANFFSPPSYRDNCALLGKTPDPKSIRPLSGYDFVQFLEKKEILSDPLRYANRIRQLLDCMASTGLLTEMGQSSNVMMPKTFYFQKELTNIEKNGIFWLSPALGSDFIYHLAAPAIVHITGVDKNGDVCAGTGIVFHEHYVLTCAHVVNDMTIDSQQVFQGIDCNIAQQFPHSKSDVAIIQIHESLATVPGLSFVSPTIAQSVLVLGFPKIPFVREAALTLQRGEVTSEAVTTLDGHKVFLYSAIARPGNSGGPIFSGDGHVVGISMQDLSYKDEAFSPHYAGIPTHEIAAAIEDLEIGVQIPIEHYQ